MAESDRFARSESWAFEPVIDRERRIGTAAVASFKFEGNIFDRCLCSPAPEHRGRVGKSASTWSILLPVSTASNLRRFEALRKKGAMWLTKPTALSPDVDQLRVPGRNSINDITREGISLFVDYRNQPEHSRKARSPASMILICNRHPLLKNTSTTAHANRHEAIMRTAFSQLISRLHTGAGVRLQQPVG
jgi:hypothetical protein